MSPLAERQSLQETLHLSYMLFSDYIRRRQKKTVKPFVLV